MLIRSAELIGWALGGIEREIVETRSRLASLTSQAAQLRKRIGLRGPGRPPAAAAAVQTEEAPAAAPNRKRRRRKMSPEARKRISEMMKKRWAERKRNK